MSETNREAKVRTKEVRRAPQEEPVGLGNRLKKKLTKKQRGEWKIRMTSSRRLGLNMPESWIWNRYRDENSARGALRNLGSKFSFYFIEILDPHDQVLADNREAYEVRRKKDAEMRAQAIESPIYKVI